MRPPITWSSVTDPDIFNNGTVIETLVNTRSAILQPFIEEVSHKIGIKLDFRHTCGRYYVMVKASEYEEALKRLEENQVEWSKVCKTNEEILNQCNL
jgi:hypothetical protein